MRYWLKEWAGPLNLVLQVVILCFLAYLLSEVRTLQLDNRLQGVDIQSVREALAREQIYVEN